MEDDLDAWELVWVVTQEDKAIVIIQMFTQQLHHGANYHFNHIALLNQLPGLGEERERKGGRGW